MRLSTKSTAAIAIASLVAGCAGSTNVNVLQEGPEAVQVYRHGAAGAAPDRTNAALVAELRQHHEVAQRELPRYEAWSRSALNEINQLFPMHENPAITIYVYPHLATAEQVPVPGYTTATRLYTRDQYALPGELPANYPLRTYRRTVNLAVPPVPETEDEDFIRSGASE